MTNYESWDCYPTPHLQRSLRTFEDAIAILEGLPDVDAAKRALLSDYRKHHAIVTQLLNTRKEGGTP